MIPKDIDEYMNHNYKKINKTGVAWHLWKNILRIKFLSMKGGLCVPTHLMKTLSYT